MKWFCRPLGIVGVTVEQAPTVLPTLSGKLGQLTSQLKVQSWVDFIGYFVMRMNGFMKLNL
jgi:hypothetical protein